MIRREGGGVLGGAAFCSHVIKGKMEQQRKSVFMEKNGSTKYNMLQKYISSSILNTNCRFYIV
jgi:hypothetical protein